MIHELISSLSAKHGFLALYQQPGQDDFYAAVRHN